MELFDAVVVGAGPAGSTLARTLARNGLRALLVEKETPGSRRVCGGFAGPEITDFFSSVGLSAQFAALPKNEIHQVRVSGPRSGALDTPLTHGPGWSVDRSIFDSWLAQEAVAGGAELITHSTIASAHKKAGLWEIEVETNNSRRSIRSRRLLMTTGRRSPRRLSPGQKVFFACKTAYENTAIPPDRVTLHFVKKGHIGLNPIGGGKIAMCLYVESSYLKSCKGDLDEMMEALKRSNPNLGKDLSGARRIADWQTCAAEPDHKRFFYRDGVFFAGDALTMVHPIVGGGMSVATASAQILGDIIVRDRLRGLKDEQIAFEYKKACDPPPKIKSTCQ
jgi:flavin-dependent dehydrogenase